MRKIFLLVAVVAMSIAASATNLFTGSQHVSWTDGGLDIAAEQFADAVPGQKIVVTYTDASDGLEFKVMNANFDHLAGSRQSVWINGNGSYEQFLTATAVDSIKLHGLQIIGANFTVTNVDLLDGKDLKEGYTVWTGFYWADQWSTLELYRDGYSNVDFSRVEAIRFYTEAAGTEYVLNFKESFDEGGHFADQTNMTDGVGYKELVLTNELRSRVANASHWLIQFNKEELQPFNVTDVVLVLAPSTTAKYYVVGDMTNWTVNADYEMTPNNVSVDTDEEYMFNITLTTSNQFKVVKVEGETQTWYPDGMGNNYGEHGEIEHDGEYTIYFRPAMDGDEDWFYGCILAVAVTEGLEDVQSEKAESRKIMLNGMLYIVRDGKMYNVLGTEMK